MLSQNENFVFAVLYDSVVHKKSKGFLGSTPLIGVLNKGPEE